MKSSNKPSAKLKTKKLSILVTFGLLIVLFMLMVGIYMAFFGIPVNDLEKEIVSTTKSIYTTIETQLEYESSSLKSKVMDWMQRDKKFVDPSRHRPIVLPIDEKPQADLVIKDFWTPISTSGSSTNPEVVLCQLRFSAYAREPHNVPMFKDLIKISECSGNNRRFKKLKSILKDIEENNDNIEGRVVYPTGFVFHESRVGSTLIANLLGSDARNLVFSESEPPSNALMKCIGCSHEDHVQLFRDVVTAMGRSPYHERLFFKFQSITTTQMKIALEAFPDVPWVFVYRSPVQTMMSHVDPSKGTRGAPCLRSKQNPSMKVKDIIVKAELKISSLSDPGFCAAHLAMLCSHAQEAYEEYGHYHNNIQRHFLGEEGAYHGEQRGIILNYEALPGLVSTAVLSLFGLTPTSSWLSQMAYVSTQYSKGRSGSQKKGTFNGDSKQKDEKANAEIRKYASLLLEPSYQTLTNYAIEGVETVLGRKLQLSEDGSPNWTSLKTINAPDGGYIAPPQLDTSTSNNGKENLKRLRQQDASSSRQGVVARKQQHASSNTLSQYISALNMVDPMSNPFNTVHNSTPFERVECPDIPPKDYPKAYPIKNILDNWNTDDANIPLHHYDSLCHFDYQTEYEKALAYRNAEVPFVVYNIPELNSVVEKWSDPDYLNSKLGPTKKYKCETSENNHFMYWRKTSNAANVKDRDGHPWKEPTGHASLTFESWLKNAIENHNKTLDQRNHLYFRVTAMNPHAENSWIFDELTFFQPKKSLFMVDPTAQQGIHCRFGMKSVIAESHFDGSRNFAISIGGLRRWILNSPSQCEYMHLLPKGHPSGRHSDVDWSKPDYEKYPKFQYLQANEVLVRPGDAVYLPTAWFHYIVSLNVNYQCNSRSGKSHEWDNSLRNCGF